MAGLLRSALLALLCGRCAAHAASRSFLRSTLHAGDGAHSSVCPATAAEAGSLLDREPARLAPIPLDSAPAIAPEPAVELAPGGLAVPGRTLDGAAPLAQRAAFQIRRTWFSLTGMDYTGKNPNGTYLFGSQGDFWTMHRHTHFFDGVSGLRLAEFKAQLFTLRRVFDILSYKPLCLDQVPEECDSGGLPLFKFAKVTKWLQPMWPRWTVERYHCDGTVGSVLWEVATRHWFDIVDRYDMTSPGVAGPVGTLDQAALFQVASTHDVWLAAGQDLALGAATAFLVDATRLVGSSSGSSSSRRRHHHHR